MIYQQRFNGQLNRLFNAPTLMRFRMIEKENYQVLPVTKKRKKRISIILFFFFFFEKNENKT